MKWLIEPETMAELKSNIERFSCDTDEYRAYQAASRQPLAIKNGKAGIVIEGILTKTPEKWLRYFGIPTTAYSEIIEETKAAIEGGAKEITYNINSGGGYVTGMYEAMNVIRECGVKTVAKVEDMAASAAYMLASQCDTIEAKDSMTTIGSVGVAVSYYVSDYIIDIANTESQEKRPDVKTEEGKKSVQKELDDAYAIIVEKIAEGRKTTVEKINQNYGKGAVMTARKALAAGMIDAIEEDKEEEEEKQPSTEAKKERGFKMNKEQLMAEHPELFASIIKEAKAEGKTEGKKEALQNVNAHLELADASGDMDRARADIAEGKSVDGNVLAHHTAEGIKKMKIAQRDEDSPESTSDASTTGVIDAKKEQDLIAKKLEKEFEAEGIQVIF